MGVQIRVDISNEEKTRKEIDEFIEAYNPEKYVIVREDSGNNPHYHIYVSMPGETKELAKLRGWWKYREYTKDQLCVKKWGDDDHDLHYFFKGDKETRDVNCVRTTVDVFTQSKMHEAFWAENERLKHDKERKKATNLTTLLVADCIAKGAKSQLEVVQTFTASRVGLAGLCRYKHGPIIRSAWLQLNRSEPAHKEHMDETWVAQIFYED